MSNITKIVVDGYEFVSGGGGDDLLSEVCNNSLSGSITLSAATIIKSGMFIGNNQNFSISAPLITKINPRAFKNSKLTSISAPELLTTEESDSAAGYSYVGEAFMGCSLLTSVNFPKLKTVARYTFRNCTSLNNATFPELTTGAISSFNNSGLTSVTNTNFPKLSSIAEQMFTNCASLTLVNLNTISSQPAASGFSYCSSLQSATIKAPNDNSTWGFGQSFFRDCSSLTYFETNLKGNFGANAFNGCSSLTTIKLPNTTGITGVANTSDVFPAGASITVYVPASLKANYEANANWSAWITAGVITFANIT